MNEKEIRYREKPKGSKRVEIGGSIGEIHLLENGAPPYELRIDSEGRWFHEGVEIVREEIRTLFSRHLVRHEDGSYWVRMENDEAPVIVDDVPFVIVRVTRGEHGGFMLLMNDGTSEPLDARTIVFTAANVPYCRVRSDLGARFSRPAYYQLARFIEYDEKNDKYLLRLDGETVEIRCRQQEV